MHKKKIRTFTGWTVNRWPFNVLIKNQIKTSDSESSLLLYVVYIKKEPRRLSPVEYLSTQHNQQRLFYFSQRNKLGFLFMFLVFRFSKSVSFSDSRFQSVQDGRRRRADGERRQVISSFTNRNPHPHMCVCGCIFIDSISLFFPKTTVVILLQNRLHSIFFLVLY